jgi:activator of HSP90 ATPase
MAETIKMTLKLPVKPRTIYEAWLDSKKHSAFTGKEAEIERRVDAEFSVIDGYITGKNLKLYRFNKIVQSWRAADFPEEAEDSVITLMLEEIKEGTKLTIIHENLPDGEGKKYRQSWRENYFKPMKEFFSEEE